MIQLNYFAIYNWDKVIAFGLKKKKKLDFNLSLLSQKK